MIEQDNNKKRTFYMIILLLTLIAMIVGATFAYYKLLASQKKDGTVLYSGYLQISYVDGVYVKNPELFPVKDSNVNYNTYNKVYRNRFSIVSSGTLDQTLSIDLEITRNDFRTNELKYAIFNKDGVELVRGYLPKEGTVNLADNIFLNYNGTATYTIIIWWNDDGTNQADMAGSIITGKFTAYSKQVKY